MSPTSILSRAALLLRYLVLSLRLAWLMLGLTARAWGQCPASFSPAVTYQSFPVTAAVALADLDADGQLDAVVGYLNMSFGGGVSVMLGNGAGGFQLPRFIPSYGGVTSIIVTDLNGDGRLDAVASCYNSIGPYGVTVFLGAGDGTLLNEGFYPVVYANSVVVADLNRDGRPDLAVGLRSYPMLAILLGNGDGTFQSPVYDNGLMAMPWLAAADFNRDGRIDLAGVVNGDRYRVMLGNGDGTFQALVATPIPGAVALSGVAVGDLGPDGIADLVMTDQTANAVFSLAGNGDGTFQLRSTVTNLPRAASPVIGDLDGDGVPDLAITYPPTHLSVLLGAGGGTFNPPVSFQVPGYASSIVPVDINRDGRVDLAVASTSGMVSMLNAMYRPVIVRQPPACRAAAAGKSVTMSVAAAGAGPLVYQWRRNGVPLADGGAVAGAATASLTIASLRAADAGSYDVQVSAPSCAARVTTSAPVTVEMIGPSCPADFDGSGAVDPFDVARFIQAWFAALNTGC